MFVELLLLASLEAPLQPAPSEETTEFSATPVLLLHCQPRPTLLDQIKAHGATPLFVGVSGPRLALEVWASPALPDAPWLAFVTRADGSACVMAHGRGLSFADPAIASSPTRPPGQRTPDPWPEPPAILW